MLPASMRRNALIVWRIISLDGHVSAHPGSHDHSLFYLDDGHDVGRGSFEFTQVDVEMVQFVVLGFGQDDR